MLKVYVKETIQCLKKHLLDQLSEMKSAILLISVLLCWVPGERVEGSIRNIYWSYG